MGLLPSATTQKKTPSSAAGTLGGAPPRPLRALVHGGWPGPRPPDAPPFRPGAHRLQRWFGVDVFVTLHPASYSARFLDEKEASTISRWASLHATVRHRVTAARA
jgi:hypothetical protein